MPTVTIQDLLNCASQTPTYGNDIPVPVTQYTISERELMCDERIPVYSLPEPVIPTAVKVDTRLLNFEDGHATPLCLKPPTKACRKRHREEDEVTYACNESNTLSPKAPHNSEEWLSWINWESME